MRAFLRKYEPLLDAFFCSFLLFVLCAFVFFSDTSSLIGLIDYAGMPICFMVFTAILLRKLKSETRPAWKIVCAIIVGRYLFSLPIHVLDFHGTLGTFPAEVLTLLAILLGWLCAAKPRLLTWLASLTLIVLAGCWFASSWEHWMLFIRS